MLPSPARHLNAWLTALGLLRRTPRTISELHENIAALEAEEEILAQTWRTRRSEFHAIAGALTTMGGH